MMPMCSIAAEAPLKTNIIPTFADRVAVGLCVRTGWTDVRHLDASIS